VTERGAGERERCRATQSAGRLAVDNRTGQKKVDFSLMAGWETEGVPALLGRIQCARRQVSAPCRLREKTLGREWTATLRRSRFECAGLNMGCNHLQIIAKCWVKYGLQPLADHSEVLA
jgi:hypothetical protein